MSNVEQNAPLTMEQKRRCLQLIKPEYHARITTLDGVLTNMLWDIVTTVAVSQNPESSGKSEFEVAMSILGNGKDGGIVAVTADWPFATGPVAGTGPGQHYDPIPHNL